MRVRPLLLVALLASSAPVAFTGCRSKVVPPPPKPVTAWTPEIGAGSAATLVDAMAADGWVDRFRETNGRQPVVAVGAIEDRSGDHVPVDEFAAAVRSRIAASDRVLSAAPNGPVADATLVGVVGLRPVDAGREYTVDVRVLDKGGDPVWFSGITRPRP